MVVAESELGKSFLDVGRWSDAQAAFESALRIDASPHVLEGLAEALWWQGEVTASVAYYQRAYASYRDRGDSLAAAWTAIELCITYKCCLGNEAAARGWLSRARTAASASDLAVVQGWLWSFEGYLELEHNLALAAAFEEKALAYAHASGDRDLELISLANLGIALAKSGRVDEGLRLVDEAMAGISAGEHRQRKTMVTVCCLMLMVCEVTADLPRATQWTRIADRFLQSYGCPFLYGECRTMYGGILLANGRWAEAERELLNALRVTEGVYPTVHTRAASYLTELRLRQGRIEEAGRLLVGAEEEVQAALAMAALELALGQAPHAAALLERVLRNADPDSIVSVRASELLVEAQLASERPPLAREALSRLEATALRNMGPEASARVSMAAGRVAAAENEGAAAIAHFEKAMACFTRLEMPYEVARARLALAQAAKETSHALAVAEAERALDVFHALGAKPGVDAALALLRGLGVRTPPGPKGLGLLTTREQEVLMLLGAGLSNPEIAERLVISRKTVAHHVSSLLSKLAVRNRAEAASFAARMNEAQVR
jgi:ATP/maltotriose-dependent transcriptional regulator MalT